jgi:hypothetical protein
MLKESKESPIKSIGGPIEVDISVFQVSEKGKLIMDDHETRNNRIYFTKKFLKNNDNEIKPIHLKKIAVKVFNNKLDRRVLAINTVDNFNI